MSWLFSAVAKLVLSVAVRGKDIGSRPSPAARRPAAREAVSNNL
jgi:hypothetical protein